MDMLIEQQNQNEELCLKFKLIKSSEFKTKISEYNLELKDQLKDRFTEGQLIKGPLINYLDYINALLCSEENIIPLTSLTYTVMIARTKDIIFLIYIYKNTETNKTMICERRYKHEDNLEIYEQRCIHDDDLANYDDTSILLKAIENELLFKLKLIEKNTAPQILYNDLDNLFPMQFRKISNKKSELMEINQLVDQIKEIGCKDFHNQSITPDISSAQYNYVSNPFFLKDYRCKYYKIIVLDYYIRSKIKILKK